MIYHIDFETRSELDLRDVGLHNYARHASTEPWCMAYTAGEDEPSLWVMGEPLPLDLRLHVESGGEVWAHNVHFELEIWNEIGHKRFGWPVLKPEQAYCTMAQCYAMGLPGGLEEAAMALGLHILKDVEGRSIMLRMSRPRRRNPVVWWDEPEKLARLHEYCKQDVRVEREIHKRVMPLSDVERKVWLADYAINKRGVKVDLETAKAAIVMAESLKAKYDEEMNVATGGAASSCSALIPIKKWLAENGCPQATDGMAKQDLIDLLADETIPEAAKRVLALRQEAGKASAAKFTKMVEQAGDNGRLHFLYQYHGAASGRWAGRSVQPHNLVRDMPKPHVVEDVFRLVRDGKYELIDMLHGSPLSMITRSIRSIFIPDTGKVIVGGDWSNVEGRGQAWFAGEWWKVKAFREADAGTGPGLYELAYSRMFGIPVEEIVAEGKKSTKRQIGKVCLAEGSKVLCDSGWKRIEKVTSEDLVWDGDQWVRHAGLQDNGLRETVPLSGLWLTPDHLVWSENGWETAERRAASAESTYLALATASAHLLSPGTSVAFSKAGSAASSLPATAVVVSTWLRRGIFVAGARLAAMIAGERPVAESTTGGTRAQWLKPSIAAGCSTVSPQPSVVAISLARRAMSTTVSAASKFILNGARIARHSWDTFRLSTAGTILRWSWTVSTRTATTSRATCASFPAEKTLSTNERSQTSKRSARVYDLLSVGSKNRFTVWSQSGPLIVHNCELAFGYQGGIGSFHTMGRVYDVKVPDADADRFKEAWRDAHPRIAGPRDEYGVRKGGMWQRLQYAAIQAVASPGKTTLVERGDVGGPSVKFRMVGSFLWMLLPSGRAICFPYPKLLEGSYGPQLTYMTVPDPNKPEKVVHDPANGSRWARVGTYGGAIFNRVIQGMCRDFLAQLIVDLHDQGAGIIIHTHDDCNIEVDRSKANAAREAMERMMGTPPEWAKGFPLYAGCDVMERYGAVDD